MSELDVGTRIEAIRKRFIETSLEEQGPGAVDQALVEDSGVFTNFNQWPRDFHEWAQFSDFHDVGEDVDTDKNVSKSVP